MESIIISDFTHTYVRLHENLVAYYVHILSGSLQIDPQKIAFAAIFHDHGKYTWKQDLFHKTNLTDEDWVTIKKHPEISVDIALKFIPERKAFILDGSPSIADIIYLHHEKPDGSGYYGIKDIPLEVAVLEVADVFDACLSDRPYRSAMEKEKALNIAVSPFIDYFVDKGYGQNFIETTLRKTFMQNTITKIAICQP